MNGMEYVKEMNRRTTEQFDREEKKNCFRKNFKEAIENGMTESDFMHKYACTESDMEVFREIAEEVKQEKELGENFLAGFNSCLY